VEEFFLSAVESKTHEMEIDMRRSNLEVHLDVLKTLRFQGPLRLTHIMYRANVNCSVLKEYLDFLIQQNLVEEKTLGKKRIVYAITERGITALKNLRQLETTIQMACTTALT